MSADRGSSLCHKLVGHQSVARVSALNRLIWSRKPRILPWWISGSTQEVEGQETVEEQWRVRADDPVPIPPNGLSKQPNKNRSKNKSYESSAQKPSKFLPNLDLAFSFIPKVAGYIRFIIIPQISSGNRWMWSSTGCCSFCPSINFFCCVECVQQRRVTAKAKGSI